MIRVLAVVGVGGRGEAHIYVFGGVLIFDYDTKGVLLSVGTKKTIGVKREDFEKFRVRGPDARREKPIGRKWEDFEKCRVPGPDARAPPVCQQRTTRGSC